MKAARKRRRKADGKVKLAFKPRPVRRGQLISPFGVGSMNDFRKDEALMCAGLDEWFRSPPEATLRIQEERLGAKLRCEYFVKPPEFSEAEGGPDRYRTSDSRYGTTASLFPDEEGATVRRGPASMP